MNFRTAAKLGLGTLLAGIAISTFHTIGILNQIAELSSVTWLDLTYFFFGATNWIYFGLISLFCFIIFSPGLQKTGVVITGIAALLQTVFSGIDIYSIVWFPLDGMGHYVWLTYVKMAAALAVLVFAILVLLRPAGRAAKFAALAAGLAVIAGALVQVSSLSLDGLVLAEIISATFVAQWFWVLFLNWDKVRLV